MSPRGAATQKSGAVLFVRCTKEQYERFEREAQRRGMTLAAFARAELLEACDFAEQRADARAKPL